MHLSASHSPVSPEVQPRFVKGTKRYGRRSTPEFTHTISDLVRTPSVETQEDEATSTSDGTLPVKREVRHATNPLTHTTTHYTVTHPAPYLLYPISKSQEKQSGSRGQFLAFKC